MSRTSVAFDINNLSNTMIPDVVYIDTCSVMDIAVQRNLGADTETFLQTLNQHDSIITWSQFTIDEIIKFYHVDTYIAYANQNKIKPYKNTPAWKIAENIVSDLESSNLAKQIMTKVEKTTLFLEQYGVQTEVDEKELVLLTNEIFKQYGGNQQDSKHVAIASLSGTNNFLTSDSGFLKYPHTNVYGASNKIVNNFKSTNTPNDYVNLNDLLLK